MGIDLRRIKDRRGSMKDNMRDKTMPLKETREQVRLKYKNNKGDMDLFRSKPSYGTRTLNCRRNLK